MDSGSVFGWLTWTIEGYLVVVLKIPGGIDEALRTVFRSCTNVGDISACSGSSLDNRIVL